MSVKSRLLELYQKRTKNKNNIYARLAQFRQMADRVRAIRLFPICPRLAG